MHIRTLTRRTFALALCGVLAACGIPIPQADLTFSRPATLAELEQRSPVDLTTQRLLDRYEQQELYKSLRLAMHKPQGEGPLVDVGFFPGRHDGYAVYRDGTAVQLNTAGLMVELDKLAPRIDRAFVAGPSRRRIIGVNNRGTNASWNTANLTQQLVLRPQNTTFSQRQTFAAEPVEGSYLATATEGQRLELWSLISGNRVWSQRLIGMQPRSIAAGSSRNGIVFGTDAGEVRITDRNGHTRLLYSHSGPVLNVRLLPKHGLIVSSSKDGTVKIYNRYHGTIVAHTVFSRAVYQLEVSPDETHVVAIPANGIPHVIDLKTFSIRRIAGHPGGVTSQFAFINNQVAVSLQGGNGVMTWNVAIPARTVSIPTRIGQRITSYALAKPQNLVLVATSDNKLQYFDLSSRSVIATALETSVPIAAVSVSDDGLWALVALADRRVIQMRIDPTQPVPARLQ